MRKVKAGLAVLVADDKTKLNKIKELYIKNSTIYIDENTIP